MNKIEIKDYELKWLSERENRYILKWIEEELRLNPEYQYHNRDFNQLSGRGLTIIYKLEEKESEDQLFKWLLEELLINPSEFYPEDILKRLPRNVNREET